MSYVADLILTEFDSDFEGPPCQSVQNINAWLAAEHSGSEFKPVDDYAGGTKGMQIRVWLAAVNYLDVEGLEKIVREQTWDFVECVQLLLKNENDDRFRFLIESLVPEKSC